MSNLKEYTDNYSKVTGVRWQYWRNEPALIANAITNFNAVNGITNLLNSR